MKIEFFAKANYGSYENVSFNVFGTDISLIEISPSSKVTIDENGISGYAIISLNVEEKLYRIYLNAKKEEEILDEVVFYLRNEQGNALELTEEQYERFAKEKEEMWLSSNAEEKAKADLEALRARGLQIAVEKWPKEEKFIPLQNNIGETLEKEDNSLYEINLTQEAINNPLYKDIIKVELTPTDPNCYYANFTTDESIIIKPLCANLLANLKIIARLKNPHDSNKQVDWPDVAINARIYYRGLVEDECTGNCKTSEFTKMITIAREYSTIDQRFVGTATTLVNVPPSGFYALEAIDFFTYNENVRAGECHMAVGPATDPFCLDEHPEWTEGSEHIYYYQNGSYGSGAMIETVRCYSNSTIPECQGFKESPNDPLHLQHYVAIVNVTNYDTSTGIRVEKIPQFKKLWDVNNFWAGNGFAQNYLDFRSCVGDYSNSNFHYKCSSNPIITMPYSISFGEQIYHETGHWFMYRIQGNDIGNMGGSGGSCATTYHDIAFTEGFAEWHKDFTANREEHNQEKDVPCAHNYDIQYYTHTNSIFSVYNILWDIFDQIDDPEKDNIPINTSLQCYDKINLPAYKLLEYIGHKSYTFAQFFRIMSYSGMPLDDSNYSPDIKCALLNGHGYISYNTNDCQIVVP